MRILFYSYAYYPSVGGVEYPTDGGDTLSRVDRFNGATPCEAWKTFRSRRRRVTTSRAGRG